MPKIISHGKKRDMKRRNLCSFGAAHLLPHESNENSWRTEYFEFLNEKLDQIESEISMDKIEDITNTIFQNKSEILGQMALGLIKRKHGCFVGTGNIAIVPIAESRQGPGTKR